MNANGKKCILYVVEIAVVFNYMLPVILLHCSCTIITHPVVDIFFFIIITREISFRTNSNKSDKL